MRDIGPIVGVIVGVTLLLARRRFARSVIASQNAFWGSRFGEREIRISEIVAILVGVGFVVLSLLALTGVIPSR